MNKTQLFACVAGVLVGASAFAQGTFTFSSLGLKDAQGNTVKLKILGIDGAPIAGSNFLIDVLVKNPLTGEFTDQGLIKHGATSDNPFVPISPLTGASAGLFVGGTIVVPFLAPDAPASIKIEAWDKTTGLTYDLAVDKSTITFDIAKLGGSGSPPTLPAAISNFSSFALVHTVITNVPEPTTYALAALGLGGLLLFRRK